MILDPATIEVARQRATTWSDKLDRCYGPTLDDARVARCVAQTLFGQGGFASSRHPDAVGENTIAGVLASGSGSCAALVAIALALSEARSGSLRAAVFRDHVVLGLKESGLAFETLEGGRETDVATVPHHPAPMDGRSRLDGIAFVPFYLDNLGARLVAAGNTPKAIEMFEAALARAPRFGRTHYNYGTLLLGLKRFDAALEHFDGAIKADWDDAPTWINRGAALEGLGRTRDAERSYRRALQKDPESAAARTNLERLEKARRGSVHL